jgi:hypothetical protein
MYLAAATANDRTRFFDVLSMNGVAQVANKYPSATVIFVDKKQRDAKAPKVDELFRILLARAKPIRTETGWHNCALESAKRLILNVLQNPDAKIETFARTSADANEDTSLTHGYVYAFANKKHGWLKVGMTSKNEEERCWSRIRDYIKAHSLPPDGWDFVGFIPCMQAQKLETLIHRKLKKFRVANGRSQELFKCSLAVYLGVLDVLDEFIEANSPDMAAEAARREREKQEREAREAQQRAYTEAQERERRERDAREREAREGEAREAQQRAYAEAQERERCERDAREREAREGEAREAQQRAYAEAQRRELDEEARKQRERESRQHDKENVGKRLRYAVLGVIGLLILSAMIASAPSPPAPARQTPVATRQQDAEAARLREANAAKQHEAEQAEAQRKYEAQQRALADALERAQQAEGEAARLREAEQTRQREAAQRTANTTCQFSLNDHRDLSVRFTNKTPDGHIQLVELNGNVLHEPSEWRWFTASATTTYASETQDVRIDVTGDRASYLGRDPDGRHSVGGTGSCSIIAGGPSAG